MGLGFLGFFLFSSLFWFYGLFFFQMLELQDFKGRYLLNSLVLVFPLELMIFHYFNYFHYSVSNHACSRIYDESPASKPHLETGSISSLGSEHFAH